MGQETDELVVPTAWRSPNLVTEPDPDLDRLATVVLDAAFAVHRSMGPGFVESVYEESLAIELRRLAIPFQRQVSIPLSYRGLAVGECRLDLLVGERLVVEVKAVEALAPVHFAQVISYLRASRCRLGLLVNFNVHRLQRGVRRVLLAAPTPRP